MSAPKIPEGGTFFDTLSTNFKDVPIDAAHDDAIDTTAFCNAAESLVTLFDLLGSVAFKPVKSDMTGNIAKIRTRLQADPANANNLQALIKKELSEKKHTAAEGALWLNRGLDFTAQALRHNLSNPSEELATSFREAYGKTLKPHHSFVIKPIFSAAMGATPYRKDFYAKMGEQSKVDQEVEPWLSGIEKSVKILNDFFAKKENKW